MSLREEIKPYIDGRGFVAPNIVPPGEMRGSDNGEMFSSEYHIILAESEENDEKDADVWEKQIGTLEKVPGLLEDPDGFIAPDNAVAVFAAAKELNKPALAQRMLAYGFKHFGFYNTNHPNNIKNEHGKLDFKAFLWRQPQLLFANLCAAGVAKFWHGPLAVYTALVILYAALRNANPVQETDARRLTWLLILATRWDSVLCYFAGKLWVRKLLKDYPNGMKDVCNIYYKDNHPFGRYIDERGWL